MSKRDTIRYLIKVVHRKVTTVEVEAEDPIAAAQKARLFKATDGHVLDSYEVDAEIIRVIGEPWASTWGWYDLHGPGDVIVITRAYGNLFTGRDIALLKRRIGRLGLRVCEYWNGEGRSTVSFRATGRKGKKPMSAAQIRSLVAPRPYSSEGAEES